MEALAPRPCAAPIRAFEPPVRDASGHLSLEPEIQRDHDLGATPGPDAGGDARGGPSGNGKHGAALETCTRAELCTWSGLESLRSDVRAAVARRCRSRRVEIEDVVQEALLRAARYRHKLIDPERLRAWVIRIGLNVLRDQMRRDLRLPRVEKGDDVFDLLEGREEIPGDPPDDDALEAEGELFERGTVMRHLDRAFEELPRSDRRVLTAYYERGDVSRRASCVREAGAELFKVRVHRARGRLERALRKRLSLGPRVRSQASPTEGCSPQNIRSATCAPVRRSGLQSGHAAGIPT